MKASKLIELLQEKINKHGNLSVNVDINDWIDHNITFIDDVVSVEDKFYVI